MAEKKCYRVTYRVGMFCGFCSERTIVKAESSEEAKRRVELRRFMEPFMADHRFCGVESVKEIHGVLDFLL